MLCCFARNARSVCFAFYYQTTATSDASVAAASAGVSIAQNPHSSEHRLQCQRIRKCADCVCGVQIRAVRDLYLRAYSVCVCVCVPNRLPIA